MDTNKIVNIKPDSEMESSDTYLHTSRVIAEMEIQKLTIPENLQCSFTFEWLNYEIPTVSRIETECSEDVISKELENNINERLSLIVKSCQEKYRSNSTDKYLIAEVSRIPLITEIVKERIQEIRETKLALQNGYFPLIEHSNCTPKLLFLLMAVTNNQIPPETVRRVLDLLEKEVDVK